MRSNEIEVKSVYSAKDFIELLYKMIVNGKVEEAKKLILASDPSASRDKGILVVLRKIIFNGKIKEAKEFILAIDPDILLFKITQEIDIFFYAVSKCSDDIAALLLKQQPKFLNIKRYEASQLMCFICLRSHSMSQTLKTIYNLNPKFFELTHTSKEVTILHLAAQGDWIETCKSLLLIKPQLINARSNAGLTPLHSASVSGHGEIMDVLLFAQPSLINDVNRTDYTALLLAMTEKRTDNFIELISKGCKITRPDILRRCVLKLSKHLKEKCFRVLALATKIDKLLSIRDVNSIDSSLVKMFNSAEATYDRILFREIFFDRIRHLWMNNVKAGDKTLDDCEAALVSHRRSIPKDIYDKAYGILNRLKEGLVDIKHVASVFVGCDRPQDAKLLPKDYPAARYIITADLTSLRKLLGDVDVVKLQQAACDYSKANYFAFTRVTKSNSKGNFYLPEMVTAEIAKYLQSYMCQLREAQRRCTRVNDNKGKVEELAI